MKVLDIVEQVRIQLDYNHTVLPIDVPMEDTLDIDTVIRQQMIPASRLVMLSAPKEHIDWENIAPAAQYTWDEGLGLLTVLLPRDMLMLSAVKMKCWRRPVLRLTDIDSAKYQSTMTEFKSLRPTVQRPITSLIQQPDGPTLEMWGCTDDNHDVDYCLLRRAPHIEEKTEDGKTYEIIDVPAILQAPYVYMTAALTAESLKDTQKAQTLISLAQGMLGVGIERRAIYQPRPTTAGAPETSTIPQPQQQ